MSYAERLNYGFDLINTGMESDADTAATIFDALTEADEIEYVECN